jgi:uncharacterized protein (TIGR02246 family)
MSRVVILVGCLVLAAAPAMAQSKAAIQKLETAWGAAFNKGDAKAVAAMYTADAYVMPSGAPMQHGAQAIEAFWQQAMQQLGDVHCKTLAVTPLGRNAASEIGTCMFKTKAQPPGNGTLKYAVIWEKEGNAWKLQTDMWNMDK